MANFTGGTKPLRMSIIVHMTGDALAFGAFMVENAGLPGIRTMTGSAVCAKFSVMGIVNFVTGHAC